ncbi:4-hydroxythreonine-4-phosphate dehydrogenase PdxA, partial [Pseudomonas aeruginosa]|nr:4-hydroxythreonine-4-phosphate dehydrogenase PdxA [Pseudomonas aeruginosa]
PRSEASAVGGRYSLETLALALELTRSGRTDAILFGPLNKTSLHMAGMDHSDELHWFAERLGFGGPFCEFNVLDDLWTSRVTSHVALAEVPGLLSQERVGEAIRLIDDALRRSGLARPRIGVCGLNPHNGDNGSFGREELDIIAPAVQKAREQGIAADGPYPADTIFLKVQGDARAFDAVVTMYHDQGQIAIKLMGFSRGVTVQGGLPIPIATPAHGTAFDIAGQGRADVGATRQAFEIACRMGRRKA